MPFAFFDRGGRTLATEHQHRPHREPRRDEDPKESPARRRGVKRVRKGDLWSRVRAGLAKSGRLTGKTFIRILAGIGIVILILVIASFFVDEPMRRSMEKRMNASLKGYTVVLPRLHFSLFGGSITLRDLTIRQQANPEPPVMVVPRLKASVQWSELLTFHVVADFLLDKPRVHLNLPQLQAENRDPTPVKDKGWQDALEAIYPFKVNLFRVNDADVVYIDRDPRDTLHVAHLFIRANNIRNIHSREHFYPSPVHAEGVVFDKGRAVVDGHADFLSKPFPGIHVGYRVTSVPLDSLRPMIARANLELKGGTVSSNGEIEYAPITKLVRVADLRIEKLHLDYVHTAATAGAESVRKEKVQEAAKKATNRSDLTLKLEKLTLADSDLGYVNRAKNPAYRAYLSGVTLTVTNLSNQFVNGPATAKLTGKFMGSGPTHALAHFRPENNGSDFDLDGAIENTDMTRMNDILRAYGKFDVVAGKFSFYTQLKVQNGRIDGYVKPLFQDMDVYDKNQDRNKPLLKKAYEAVVGGVSKLLENKKSDEVATVADISGPVDNPKSSTWQIIGKLLENAFVKAILPGFDKQAAAAGLDKKAGVAPKK
jgi:hypothetical protein